MSSEFQKINGLYMRTDKGKIIRGAYARPEFQYLLDLDWEWDEKVDGTNIRLMFQYDAAFRGNEHAWIGGKTDKAQIPAFLFERLLELSTNAPWEDVIDRHRCGGDLVVVYGEGYGARIQGGGGKYIPDGVDFIAYDVRIGHFWLSRDNAREVCAALGFAFVPYFGTTTVRQAEVVVEEGLLTSAWPNVQPEGLVGRPAVPLFDANGRRIITKIKHADYNKEI